MAVRPVVWLVATALLLGRIGAIAQSHEQGVAAGAAANTVIRGLVNAPSARSVVPGYTSAPPEAAYAGRPALGADASAKLAACALLPNDPTCQALRTAVDSANTPRAAVGAGDPAVAAASTIARNPSTVLGSLAAYYSGCATQDSVTAPRIEARTCARYVGIGSYSCSNLLSVAISRTTSCPPGEWFAQARQHDTELAVQCLPDRPADSQHFRITAGRAPAVFFDVDMTQASSGPQRVADYGSGTDAGIWIADRSCTAADCSLTAMIAEGIRVFCTSTHDSGEQCTSARPFLEVYAPCGAGTQSGDNIQYSDCGGGDSGCTYGALDRTLCYAPTEGRTPYVGFDVTGALSGSFWNIVAARPVVGWSPNPDYGPIPTATLRYARPQSLATATDTWNNLCPPLADPGRCQEASAPRCVDGPATKVIDGVAVTRDCWAFERTMRCADAAAGDDCAPLAAAGCTRVASDCARTDPVSGACQRWQDRYDCPVPGETVTTTGNCPANVFCVGSGCFNTSYANDADFARSMSLLEAVREAGVYLDTDNLQVFKGEQNRCRDKLLKNCCYGDAAGRGMTNQSVFNAGTRLVYDILTNAENRKFIVQGVRALLTSAGFAGTFTSYGFTVAVNGAALPAGSSVLFASSTTAGEGLVLTFDPWSLAITAVIHVALSMMECNAEESRLALKEGASLCHTTGTYCSSCIRILGACVSCIEHTTAKCCFNSRLARIVNEQGRAQLGRTWGNPGEPDCSGFTVAQLQALDFAAMDLTEFYAALVPSIPDVGMLQANTATRVPACYWGQGRCR